MPPQGLYMLLSVPPQGWHSGLGGFSEKVASEPRTAPTSSLSTGVGEMDRRIALGIPSCPPPQTLAWNPEVQKKPGESEYSQSSGPGVTLHNPCRSWTLDSNLGVANK